MVKADRVHLRFVTALLTSVAANHMARFGTMSAPEQLSM